MPEELDACQMCGIVFVKKLVRCYRGNHNTRYMVCPNCGHELEVKVGRLVGTRVKIVKER